MKQQPSRRDVLAYGAAASVAATLGPACYAQAADFFAGKTIDVIVPFAAGGAADVTTRFVAPFLTKHIPGNPNFNITNLGGGGSILGANQFEKQGKGDGLTILSTTSSSAFPYILKQKGVEYDLSSKRVAYSIAIGPVVYASPATGIQSVADLKKPKTGLVYGGIGATASDLPVLLAFELLGLDVKTVLGFQGCGPIRLAFERGETNFDFQFTSVYLTQVKPQVEAKKAVPLFTGGSSAANGKFTERDPVVKELPSTYEVFKTLNDNKEPSGAVWGAYEMASALTFEYGVTGWMPAGTPQAALDAFSVAAAKINADPDFIAKGEKVTGGYKLQDGKAIEKNVKAALTSNPEVVQYLTKFLTEKYNVKL
jgi:tripartite-type tricarboxylate transporter receptor subunit TctC